MKSLKFRKKLYKKLIGKNKSKISNKERNNIKKVQPSIKSLHYSYIRKSKMFVFQTYVPVATPKYITVDIVVNN